MSIAVLALSAPGARAAARVAEALGAELHLHAAVAGLEVGAEPFDRVAERVAELFGRCRGLVCIMPCGVVVRALAPLVRHKLSDPAVVVGDVGGRWAVSLLSGHEGGANDLTLAVANALGAEPVVTTTSEAVRDLIVGVGCRRGTTAEAIQGAVRTALEGAGLGLEAVRYLATADVKADEPGLAEAARRLGVPLRIIPGDEIRACALEFTPSELARDKVGLPAVAEPAALLAGRRTRFVLRRQTYNGVTVAVAREDLPSLASDPAARWTAPAAPRPPSPKAT